MQWSGLHSINEPSTTWRDKLGSLVERMLETHKHSPCTLQEKESLQMEIEPSADEMIELLLYVLSFEG